MQDKKKILIVDDEQDMQKLLKMRLEQEGYDVVVADDGDIAIKMAEEQMPNLIVLDIVMPRMDGYSCLKEIRRLPKIKDVAVLMLSGKEEEKVRDLFAFQKIESYIEKPFNLDDLVSKVKKILTKK